MSVKNKWHDNVEDVDQFAVDPRSWLEDKAKEYKLKFLLVHADDGVIWGRFDGNKFALSSDGLFPNADGGPELRQETLQQARLFGPSGELLVWRSNDDFTARLIDDGETPPEEALADETYWLWGIGTDNPKEGFTLMNDGQQGLRHAPPLPVGKDARAGLVVRHYIDYDEQGQFYIAVSRLVDLVKV